MKYVLSKGGVKVHIAIGKDSARMTKSIGGNTSTSETSMTPTEAAREVARLLRDGYTASKQG